MEASLKLKEISYIHSEAYAAGELKHGTIALIEEGTLVVAMATQQALVEKTISNIKVKVREAYVLAVAMEGDERVAKEADEVWYIPSRTISSRRYSRSCRCSFSPTTWRCSAAATSRQAAEPREERYGGVEIWDWFIRE